MFTSKKRAAIIVPTAFLVAASGLVALPAMAADGTAPASIVNGEGEGDAASVAKGDTATVVFTGAADADADPAADGFQWAAGTYWVRIEYKPGTDATAAGAKVATSYQQLKYDTVSEIKVDVPMSAYVGDTYKVTLNKIPGTPAAPGTDATVNSETFADGTKQDEVTLTVADAVRVKGGAPTTLEEKGSGKVVFVNMNERRKYVTQINTDAPSEEITKKNSTEVTVAPKNGDAGTKLVKLYDVTQSADWTAAGADPKKKLEALAKLTPVAQHSITVTSVDPSVEMKTPAPVGKVDQPATAGSTVEIDFKNLDDAKKDTVYKIEVKKNGQLVVSESSPVKSVSLSSADENGYFGYQASIPTSVADLGATYTVTLSNENGTTLTKEFKVSAIELKATPEAPQNRDGFEVSMAGVPDNTDYILTRVLTNKGGAKFYALDKQQDDSTQSLPEDKTKLSKNALLKVAADQGEGVYEYVLYAVPTGDAATDYATKTTDEDRVAWLKANGTSVANKTVTVTADALRAYAPEEFTAPGAVTFEFQNFTKPADAAPTWTVDENKYAAIVTTTDQDGKVTEKAVKVVDGAEATDLKYELDPTVAETKVSVALYNAPSAASWDTASNALELVKAAGAVNGADGKALVATSVEATYKAPEAPKTEKVEQWVAAESSVKDQELPAAFAKVPTNVAKDQIWAGDFDGDGIDDAMYRTGEKSFTVVFSATGETKSFDYGRAGDEVFVGDWNDDGTETVALRRPGTNRFFIQNKLEGGEAEKTYDYGRVGDEILVGDWDNDGTDTISVRRGSTFYINNGFKGGKADYDFAYGRVGDQVYVGDWNADGKDSFTVRRGNTYYESNKHQGGEAERTFTMGSATDRAIVANNAKGGADYLFTLMVDEVEVPATK